MPEKNTLKRAAADKKAGKASTTQAGEFVREEMEHVKRGKHGVASRKQAIAIGLSKARRSGVDLAPPKPGQATEKTRKQAKRDNQRGHVKSAGVKKSAAKTASKKTAPAKKPVAAKKPAAKTAHKKATPKNAAPKKAVKKTAKR